MATGMMGRNFGLKQNDKIQVAMNVLRFILLRFIFAFFNLVIAIIFCCIR